MELAVAAPGCSVGGKRDILLLAWAACRPPYTVDKHVGLSAQLEAFVALCRLCLRTQLGALPAAGPILWWVLWFGHCWHPGAGASGSGCHWGAAPLPPSPSPSSANRPLNLPLTQRVSQPPWPQNVFIPGKPGWEHPGTRPCGTGCPQRGTAPCQPYPAAQPKLAWRNSKKTRRICVWVGLGFLQHGIVVFVWLLGVGFFFFLVGFGVFPPSGRPFLGLPNMSRGAAAAVFLLLC